MHNIATGTGQVPAQVFTGLLLVAIKPSQAQQQMHKPAQYCAASSTLLHHQLTSTTCMCNKAERGRSSSATTAGPNILFYEQFAHQLMIARATLDCNPSSVLLPGPADAGPTSLRASMQQPPPPPRAAAGGQRRGRAAAHPLARPHQPQAGAENGGGSLG